MKKLFVCTVVLAVFLTGISLMPAFAESQEMYFTTQQGISLTEQQYKNLTKVWTEEELNALPKACIEENKNDPNLKLLDSDEAYVVTRTYFDENKQPIKSVSEEVSKAEALKVAFMPEPRVATSYETSSKRLKINLIAGPADVKKVTLTNTWLVMPKVRSYDVIALRPSEPSIVYQGETFSASQNYDGQSVDYSYYGDNIKKTTKGIGVSMNIVDSVSSSLSNSMYVKFSSGAFPYTVYGTYQHAVTDVTLNQSHDYTINSNGLGGVLDFSSSVANKYDGMKGVSVTIKEYL